MDLTPKDYLKRVREQLDVVGVRVKKWIDWDPDSDVYEAFSESRSVIIPKPVDDWSFLVALHEIGHISTGDRMYSYLCEYNAEIWAIRRASNVYGIICPEYELDAKTYVKQHLVDNLLFQDLRLDKVKSYVLDWMGETHESMHLELTSIIDNNRVAEWCRSRIRYPK